MKFLIIIKQALKEFFVNNFWTTWQTIAILAASVLLNTALWYIYFAKIKQNPNPFILVSGLILLNIIMANYLWNREKLGSYFLLFTTLAIEVFMLIFARYLIVIY